MRPSSVAFLWSACSPWASSEATFYIRLRPVDGVKGLIQKESHGPGSVHPWRAVLVQAGAVVEHREEVDDYEAKACKCDLVSSD